MMALSGPCFAVGVTIPRSRVVVGVNALLSLRYSLVDRLKAPTATWNPASARWNQSFARAIQQAASMFTTRQWIDIWR